MAKEYVEKLSQLIHKLKLEDELDLPLEVKHFFSGAALYVDGRICASWSPVGLAFRLSGEEVDSLIASGKAEPLRYFEKGHIKKGYALFANPETSKASRWRTFFLKSTQQ